MKKAAIIAVVIIAILALGLLNPYVGGQLIGIFANGIVILLLVSPLIAIGLAVYFIVRWRRGRRAA